MLRCPITIDAQVRTELGISDEAKLVVFMYGGHTPGAWQLHDKSLPTGWQCLVCSNGKVPEGMQLPQNFILAEKDAYTPDLVSL